MPIGRAAAESVQMGVKHSDPGPAETLSLNLHDGSGRRVARVRIQPETWS